MVRNVECCLLFEVTNTVLELVKVHQLSNRKHGESPDQPTGFLQSITGPTNHSAGSLKAARSDGQLVPTDEAIKSKYQSGLSGRVLCS